MPDSIRPHFSHFEDIMIPTGPNLPNYIIFVKMADPFVNCLYEDPTPSSPMRVSCGFMQNNDVWLPNGLLTEEAVIHEFGHILNNRTRSLSAPPDELGLLYDWVDGTRNRCVANTDPNAIVLNNCILDNNSPTSLLVMGPFSAGWSRGHRGWGSGPDNVFTNFQQHPPNHPLFENENVQTQVDETSADMFLNWVYRVVDDSGFQNVSWAPSAMDQYPDDFVDINSDPLILVDCQTTNGCQDNINPGDARYERMQFIMETIFNTNAWE